MESYKSCESVKKFIGWKNIPLLLSSHKVYIRSLPTCILLNTASKHHSITAHYGTTTSHKVPPPTILPARVSIRAITFSECIERVPMVFQPFGSHLFFFFLPSHLLLLMWSDSLLCISCKTQFNFAFMKKARLDHTLSREVYRVPHPNVPILRSMDRHIPQRPSDLLKIVSKIIAPPLWKCMVMYAAAYEKDTKSLMDFY